MTLNDLFLLIKRYLKWVIAVPVVCAILAAGFVVVKDAGRVESYSATATLTVTDASNTLSSSSLTQLLDATARSVASDASSEDVSVAAALVSSSQAVNFTVAAPSAEAAETAADAAAEETATLMKASLSAQAETFKEEGAIPTDGMPSEQNAANAKAAALEACAFTINPAEVASTTGSSGMIKYAAVGLVGGLFVVVLVLALYDSVRRPIKTRQDIAQITDLPVLNGNGGTAGVELVRASLLTECEGVPSSVCVVAEGGDSRQFAAQLKTVFDAASEYAVDVQPLKPLSEDASGYFKVQNAEATLICVTRWSGTAAGFASCLEELKLAKTNVVGIVLV